MTQLFINNFSTTISATFGSSDTVLHLYDTTGLPALTGANAGNYFLLTLFKRTGLNDSAHEVVKVTSWVGNIATVIRSVEGAAAAVFNVGDKVEARLTAGSFINKADLDSPAFINNPTAPTPASNSNSTVLATTEFVVTERSTSATLSNKTLIDAALGSPISGVLTNVTGLPVSTGISGLAPGVAAFLATPSSVNLHTTITDETGSGNLVFSISPILETPNLGTPSLLIGTNISGTGSNFTSGITQGLKSATSTVSIDAAAAPSAGQVLTASSSTGASWQIPSAAAINISNAASGTISSTTVQAAINELATEKEPVLGAGAANQYYRGDKSWQLLDKTTVGLSNVDNTPDSSKPVSAAQAAANTSTLNSAKTYADGLVVGLWDDRGSFNASVNTYPTTNGSGIAGAILKGDIWTISSVASSGPLANLVIGTTVRAIIDTPGQTAANWAATAVGLGYMAANTALGLNQFSSTTSAQLAGVISDETGSGALVFASSPTLVTPNIGVASGTSFNSITGLASVAPLVDAVASIGISTLVARQDHVHPSTKTISNISAAYMVVAGDLGKIINCTANSFTISLTSAATLGAGFHCSIWNASNTATDAITIDPSGAETIDGIATLILRRGEGLDIISDGTNWKISNKKPMIGYAENFLNSSVRPIASGQDSIALGRESVANNLLSTAIGYKATAGYGAVAISTSNDSIGAIASNYGSISIGDNCQSVGIRGIAIGSSGVRANSTNSTAIGENSGNTGSIATSGYGAMALGGSYASGTDSFAAAIANNTSSYGATGANSIAMSNTAKASANYANAIGSYANAIGYSANAIGYSASAAGNYANAAGNYANAIGFSASAAGASANAIGYSASAGSSYSTAIGNNSVGSGSVTATSAGAMALGGSYASGADSFAAAIRDNTSSYGATGDNSVAIGLLAKSTSNGTAIGIRAWSSAAGAVAISTDDGSGYYPKAEHIYSIAIGGYAHANVIGKYAFASGGFSSLGDSQYARMVLRASATNAGVILTSNGITAAINNQVIVKIGFCLAFSGLLIGHNTAGGTTNQVAMYELKGVLAGNGNANTAAIIHSTVTLIGTDSIGLTATPTVSANSTLNSLVITSGYKTGTTTRWVATISMIELS